ncbi:hypothetical protein J8281_13340 [Aquimarina sp. U1-2]|uniref:hypothetical protein n=1 Tax=Aquimarina sp. U1-2 TaxID=2823141 RepID=UPI001AECC444|nr:hypothetical protein [Aquimarina sp. U1-2]MBP2833172.1 hypothetical protein [Aquimarina sp. U1-2]
MIPKKETVDVLNTTSHASTVAVDTSIHCFKNKPFAINYSNLLTQYQEAIENYRHYPELMDIDEFSLNYSFGYLFSTNNDDVMSKQIMFYHVKHYLRSIQIAA